MCVCVCERERERERERGGGRRKKQRRTHVIDGVFIVVDREGALPGDCVRRVYTYWWTIYQNQAYER